METDEEKYARVLKKKPFSHTKGGIILLLILLWPVGLYKMEKNEVGSVKFRAIVWLFLGIPGLIYIWKHNVFSKTTRIILTSFFPIAITLILYLTSLPPSECDCIETQERAMRRGYTDYDASRLNKCAELYGEEGWGHKWECK
jgi:hypothetical protein